MFLFCQNIARILSSVARRLRSYTELDSHFALMFLSTRASARGQLAMEGESISSRLTRLSSRRAPLRWTWTLRGNMEISTAIWHSLVLVVPLSDLKKMFEASEELERNRSRVQTRVRDYVLFCFRSHLHQIWAKEDHWECANLS